MRIVLEGDVIKCTKYQLLWIICTAVAGLWLQQMEWEYMRVIINWGNQPAQICFNMGHPVVGRCKLIRKHPKTWQLRLDHKTWESQGILARRKTTEDLHRFCWGNLAMQQ